VIHVCITNNDVFFLLPLEILIRHLHESVMATIFIPAQLHPLTGNIKQMELDVRNVRDVIDQLEQQFPGIRERLCQDNQISPALQISIDSVITSRGMIAKIQPDSEVHFIPAIGGG